MTRWREFVQDANGVGSSIRLSMLFGVFIGAFVVVWNTVKGNLGWEIFATFMGSSGGVYGFGKYRESVERVEQTKADSPNQPPVVIPPLGPTTTINVSGQVKPTDAKDVAIKAQGDVTVNSVPKKKK